MNIEFETGKQYVTRSGKIVTCISEDRELALLRNFDGTEFMVWISNGKEHTGLIETRNDIVKEYNEKTFDWTKPAQTKYYRKVLHLMLIPETNCEYCLVGKIEGNVHLSTWNKDGKAYANPSLDLINVPEKKVVPLEPGDIKPGYLIKKISQQDEPLWDSVVGVCKSKEGNYFIFAGGKSINFHDNLRYNFLISRDNGETWERCEKTI